LLHYLLKPVVLDNGETHMKVDSEIKKILKAKCVVIL